MSGSTRLFKLEPSSWRTFPGTFPQTAVFAAAGRRRHGDHDVPTPYLHVPLREVVVGLPSRVARTPEVQGGLAGETLDSEACYGGLP